MRLWSKIQSQRIHQMEFLTASLPGYAFPMRSSTQGYSFCMLSPKSSIHLALSLRRKDDMQNPKVDSGNNVLKDKLLYICCYMANRDHSIRRIGHSHLSYWRDNKVLTMTKASTFLCSTVQTFANFESDYKIDITSPFTLRMGNYREMSNISL